MGAQSTPLFTTGLIDLPKPGCGIAHPAQKSTLINMKLEPYWITNIFLVLTYLGT